MRMCVPSKLAAAAMLLVLSLWTAVSFSAPEAHILRIDPRVSQTEGTPVLTTVVELVQTKRMIDALAECTNLRGDAQTDCQSDKLEAPQALYTPINPFPEAAALFTVSVDNVDRPTTFASKARWSESLNQPGVGTAWLIVVDAASTMGTRFDDAKEIANAFIGSLTANDVVDVMFISDRLVSDSKWQPASNKAAVQGFLASLKSTYPSPRARPLGNIIKKAVTDAFGELGNVGNKIQVPLHQAMVVLSNGSAGMDAGSAGPTTQVLNQYLTKGRFPEDNTVLPKTPLPVISVWLPLKTYDELRDNAQQFMEGLANPEIGGFYDVVRAGQGAARAPKIVQAVRLRFNQMHIVKWRVSCIAPTMTQSFKLAFTNVSSPINGDATFTNIPIGIDPKSWPLDINADYTKQMAEREPVTPGNEFTVYGNFCWGGDKDRAEVYFIPSGQPLPAALAGTDANSAQQTRQQLIASHMDGRAVKSSDGDVRFVAPDNEKMLWGSGKQAVVRLVVYDSKAFRASGVTANTVLTLKGGQKAIPMLYIVGIAFGAVVLALLGVLMFRGGGGRRRASPAPAPVVAGGGSYGGPAPGGGSYGTPGPGGSYGNPGPGAPPGGQYGAGPVPGGPYGNPGPAAPGMGMGPYASPVANGPGAGPYGNPVPAGDPYGNPAPAVDPYGNPAGQGGFSPASPGNSPMGPGAMAGMAPGAVPGMGPGGGAAGAPYGGLGPSPFAPVPPVGNPMGAPPGPPPGAGTPASPDFLYGDAPPQYGLTGAVPAQTPMPPDPYAQAMGPGMPGAGMMGASRAILSGGAGVYTVVPGYEMLVGRDATRCQVVLTEPRVSGVHARMKLENGQLFVSDEQSNNGTFIDNQRIAPQNWTLAAPGSVVRFGPVDFSVRME